MKRPPLKKLIRTILLVILLPFIAFLIYMSRLDWVPAGHVGVVYDASSGLLPTVYKPSAVFIGWRQQLYVYPTRLQAAVYTEDPTAGEARAADSILITTNDNANTNFDVAVIYHVREEDVKTVFDAFGAVPIEDIQRNFIRRAVKEAANDVGTQYDLFALMGAKREEASGKLTDELRTKLSVKGITVERAMLGQCYPSQDIAQKITSRVNSYVELEISRLKRQIAEIERQVAVVQGEANMQAAEMTAAQAKDRSLELLQLETAEAAIDKWDGALPPISPKSGQTIVLTQDLLKQLGASK
ncbi:MAG: hypothetical protein GC165_20775 [Armatimonadetes bacterium]|nr:hypothetical protein [Armatimonadota bacterium]MBS1726328.1 hypothetical protein [Armatimonadota bacterium]